MIWRATGRLGHISYRAIDAVELRPCTAPPGPADILPRDSLRRGPVALWVCQRSSPCGTVHAVFCDSTPGLGCTGEFPNRLLENFGLQLVLFCDADGEEDRVDDTTGRKKLM